MRGASRDHLFVLFVCLFFHQPAFLNLFPICLWVEYFSSLTCFIVFLNRAIYKLLLELGELLLFWNVFPTPCPLQRLGTKQKVLRRIRSELLVIIRSHRPQPVRAPHEIYTTQFSPLLIRVKHCLYRLGLSTAFPDQG